jgi:hypothetical protein
MRELEHRAFSSVYCRQRPTLPYSFPYSTIGGSRLNFRVRNGNGCDPAPMTTGIVDENSEIDECRFRIADWKASLLFSISKNEWVPHMRRETRARTVMFRRSHAIPHNN